VPEIPKGEKETEVVPVQIPNETKVPTKRTSSVTPQKASRRSLRLSVRKTFGIFAKETEERVLQWNVRLHHARHVVDGNPINSMPVVVRPVGVALVVLHVNAFVEHLS